jgi:hypothetical protein
MMNRSSRHRLNGRNDAKHSKRYKARVCDEISRSWDVCGKCITPDLRSWPLHTSAIFGRAVSNRRRILLSAVPVGGAADLASPHSQFGAGSSQSSKQPSDFASFTDKRHRAIIVQWQTGNVISIQEQQIPSPSPRPSPTNLMAKRQRVNIRHDAGDNYVATLVTSVASAAIVEAIQHAHSHGNGSLATSDCN